MALSGRAAVASTAAMFGANGLLVGAYAASLPTLRERLDLDAIQLPLLLLTVGVFGIGGMQVAGRSVDHRGARQIVLIGLPVMIVGVALLAIAPGFGAALGAGVLIGLGNGSVDVAMNAFAVRVEQARSNPVMSRFHALWSLGNFAGAAVVLAWSFLVPGRHALVLAGALGLSAVAGAIAVGLLARWCPATSPLPPPGDLSNGRGRIPALAWLLGLMAVCFGLAEGTAYDWSSLHVTDVAGIDPGLGALGLGITAAFMVAIRLLGDLLVARFGRRRVVRYGGACAAIGYGLVTLLDSLPLVLAGWALVGFGVGMVAPQVYAVAGHRGGGRGLAVVVTFGYATFLAGPALMGALIALVGIQQAMIAPGLMCLALAFLAAGMPRDTRS